MTETRDRFSSQERSDVGGSAPEGGSRLSQWATPALWVFTTAFFAVYSWMIVDNFWGFRVPAFDFGIFDQGLWLIANGEEPFITVRGLHLLADHSSYILYLLAPIYWVAAVPELLLVLSVAVLASGGPLTYSIARHLGAEKTLAAAAGIGYLVHPALAWSARDNFHPELLVIPLVLAGFLLVLRDRNLWALGLFALALTTKEDAALLLAPLGLFLAWSAGRRWLGYTLAGVSIGAFLLNFLVLLPAFSPTGELLYSDRYDQIGDGIFGLATGLFTNAGVVFDNLTRTEALMYYGGMFLPVPLALLAPRLLLLTVPTLLANLLSQHQYQAEIRWHYTTYILVALGLAAAYGATRWSKRETKVVEYAALAVVVVGLAFHFTIGPVLDSSLWDEAPEHVEMEAALQLVPPDVTVSAMSPFVPHLTHRTVVYDFPNPWQRHNYGPPDVILPDPATVDWVLVSTERYEDLQPVVTQVLESGEFDIVYDRGGVLVLRR